MTLTCARLQWFSPLNHCFIPDTTFVSFEELAVKIGFTCSWVIIFLSFGLDNTIIFFTQVVLQLYFYFKCYKLFCLASIFTLYVVKKASLFLRKGIKIYQFLMVGTIGNMWNERRTVETHRIIGVKYLKMIFPEIRC